MGAMKSRVKLAGLALAPMAPKPLVKLREWAFDPAQPPEGVRLQASAMAARLRVSLSDMSEACGISRSAVRTALTTNVWPKRADLGAVREALAARLAEAGATADDVAVMWHAQMVHGEVAHPTVQSGVVAGDVAHQDDDDFVPPEKKQAGRKAPKTDTAMDAKEIDVLLPKQTLDPEAKRAFGLFTNPFSGEVTTDAEMFTSSEITYVRETCMQVALSGSFVALVAESGAGKTTVLGDVESRIQRDKRPVIVIKPWVLGMEDSDTKGKTLKSTDILASIVTTLDPLATIPQTLQARSNKARDLLIKSAEAGFSHMLVIEEAHSMPEATLKHLKRLHEMRLGRKPLLGILLLGQTELGLKLDPRRANLREVTQRCEVVHLLPLDQDLGPYLAHRAGLAGKKLGELIDDTGVEELRRRLTVERPGQGGQRKATSLLYPLAVNNLMTAALNEAAEIGAPLVTRDVVRAV